MCTQVFYCDQEISTVGELRQWVGAIVPRTSRDSPVDDECLCNVDVAATLAGAHFTEDDLGDFLVKQWPA